MYENCNVTLNGKRVDVTILVTNPETGVIEAPDAVTATLYRWVNGVPTDMSGTRELTLVDGRPGLYGYSFDMSDIIGQYSNVSIPQWVNFSGVLAYIHIWFSGPPVVNRGFLVPVRSSVTGPYIGLTNVGIGG